MAPVGQLDADAGVEEGQFPQPVLQRTEVEIVMVKVSLLGMK
jgi:hypothetical protein